MKIQPREAFAVAGLLGFFGTGLVLASVYDTPRREHAAVVALDNSASLADAGCEVLPRLAQSVLSPERASSVVAFATAPSGLIRLGAFSHRPTGRLLEGRDGHGNGLGGDVQKLVGACQSLPRPKVSPVFVLVERSLGVFPRERCGRSLTCSLIIRTDGQESVDRRLVRALSGKRSRGAKPRLDNTGIAVTFCGLGAARSLGGPRIGTVEQVWRREFTHPEQVIFRSGCALFGEAQQ